MSSNCFGSTTSQYTATLDGLGPVGDGAHAEHEFLYLDKILERTVLRAREESHCCHVDREADQFEGSQ
jgi:hypothetical protein